MAETAKDRALARGEPPTLIYAAFQRDPLNPVHDYFEVHGALYSSDVEVDEDVYEYALVRKMARRNAAREGERDG